MARHSGGGYGTGGRPALCSLRRCKRIGQRACGGRGCARGCDTRFPGSRDDDAWNQNCPVRHQATAAFDVRVERILRCRWPYEHMSYGPNQRATYFWLATYADRILRGENPADLPVVQPTKFELAVKLKTARTLGIELDASSILFRADKVIE